MDGLRQITAFTTCAFAPDFARSGNDAVQTKPVLVQVGDSLYLRGLRSV